jgi:sortase B
MKEKTRKIIRFTGYVFIVVALGLFGYNYYQTLQNKSISAKISSLNQDIINQDEVVNNSLSESEKLKISMDRINGDFKAVNTDYVGWITVANTTIDYPIVQGDDNDYYLRRNIYRESSRHGTVFMDYRNDKDYTDHHTVIYGHSMRDGTMFRPFDNYKNESFFLENPTISIRTLNGYRTYRIFSVYLVDATKRGLEIPANFKPVDELIDYYTSESRYDTKTDTSTADHILTFVSCNYDIANGRIIVHAVLEDSNEHSE